MQTRLSRGTRSSWKTGEDVCPAVTSFIPASCRAEISVDGRSSHSRAPVRRRVVYWVGIELFGPYSVQMGFYVGFKEPSMHQLLVICKVLKLSKTYYLWSFSEHIQILSPWHFPSLFGTSKQ